MGKLGGEGEEDVSWARIQVKLGGQENGIARENRVIRAANSTRRTSSLGFRTYDGNRRRNKDIWNVPKEHVTRRY